MNIYPNSKVDRFIRYFEKEGEQVLAGEILLEGVDLADLIKLISEGEFKDDFLLFNCYTLNENSLDFLSKLLKKDILYNLRKYDYYLEANSK